MSRSAKAPWRTDNGHSGVSKRAANRVHRRREDILMRAQGFDYQPCHSRGYTNPWDIRDYRLYWRDPRSTRK
jgi:hypothetical protein